MADMGAELSGTWVVDPTHTRIGFSARHAMVTKVRGAFNEVVGKVAVDAENVAHSSAVVELSAASVDTRNAQRDEHLRSADFFDAEQYPQIVFTSTSIDEVAENSYLVAGDLKIRDVTKNITVPIELVGFQRGRDGVLRAGFEGSRRVNRRDWGLEWQVALDTGGVLVSENITLEFEISAVKQDAAAPGNDGPKTTASTARTERTRD